MAVSSLVAASGGKTMYRTTLTSGTSWTVPAGVTYINVTLYGGGGGGGGSVVNTATGGNGGDGGSTTFTGATTAPGGSGGIKFQTNINTYYAGNTGTAGQTNSGLGGQPGNAVLLNNSNYSTFTASAGCAGTVVSSTLSTTPGAAISYAIGAGGSAGTGNVAGGAGGSGKIDIEYWV